MSLVDDLDIEECLCELNVDYKKSSGSSGVQLNVKVCPNPECGNSNWKVYLNAETGLGNCFSCNTGYNKWKFISFHENAEGKELYRRIGEIKKALGHTVIVKKKAIVSVETNDGELELPESITLPTSDGLNAIYLEKRGITGEYASYFRLRYCADAWHNYTKLDGSKGGQNCSERIIIPVYDLDANLVTFQARDITGEAELRYIFPAMLPGTGRYLYNGHNALAAGAKEVIVNEGAFDVAATKRVVDKFPDMKAIVPIGTFGKHLSVSQTGDADQLGAFMRLKKAGLKIVTIMWDGEADALAAALTAGEVLWKRLGLEVRIALLPPGKDPDEADQIEVYNAWADAVLLTPASLVKLRLRNPYKIPG
jgi:DNA primase